MIVLITRDWLLYLWGTNRGRRNNRLYKHRGSHKRSTDSTGNTASSRLCVK